LTLLIFKAVIDGEVIWVMDNIKVTKLNCLTNVQKRNKKVRCWKVNYIYNYLKEK
jgi:hypothetical protein